MNRKTKGSVIIPAGVNVWEHELKTARVLADYGYTVCFIAKDNGHKIKSADILIDGVPYEIKSPTTSKLSAIERNLKRAYHQSVNIVIDSRRMKRLPDKSIQKELVKQFVLTKSIRQILFVNRKRGVIDISSLV